MQFIICIVFSFFFVINFFCVCFSKLFCLNDLVKTKLSFQKGFLKKLKHRQDFCRTKRSTFTEKKTKNLSVFPDCSFDYYKNVGKKLYSVPLMCLILMTFRYNELLVRVYLRITQ